MPVGVGTLNHRKRTGGWRILVVCPLSPRQRVLVTDAGHQVAEAGYPGPGLLCVGGHQIEGLHVVSVVHRETAGRVEAAVCMPMEDVWLTALCYFVEWIYGDWGREKTNLIICGKTLIILVSCWHESQLEWWSWWYPMFRFTTLLATVLHLRTSPFIYMKVSSSSFFSTNESIRACVLPKANISKPEVKDLLFSRNNWESSSLSLISSIMCWKT